MKSTTRITIFAVFCAIALAACGSSDDGPSAPAAPVVTLSYGIKQLQFSWPAVAGATRYRLFERPDATAAFAQVGADLTGTAINHDIALHRRVNAAYRIEACNDGGCTASQTVSLAANLLPTIGYFKASNTGATDRLGRAIALSSDGTTMAVGAPTEASSATGINGNQQDETAPFAGAVYVFIRSGGIWTQQAYVKASNTELDDEFGGAVALSADGSTLAVAARREDSNASGINGDQLNNLASISGAVYLFARNAGTWTQQAYIKPSQTEENDAFGAALALSADGATLAVGAPNDDSSATGINGNQSDNLAFNAGAVYVFVRNAGVWSQQAYVKASNTMLNNVNTDDQNVDFGATVALSADGLTLAVGATGERSNATGINGNQSDISIIGAGAVYIFTRSAGVWSQQAYIKASNTATGDGFGTAVALSADGSTLAVAALYEDSAATGLNGDQFDNSALSSGAVYVFTRSAGTWTQQAYIKASNAEANDLFGSALALSGDGSTLVAGAGSEDSAAIGINGDQASNSASNSGAVYVFARSAGTWTQQAYIKASNGEAQDEFGFAVAISADGATLAIGASGEDSGATGIGGNQSDNSTASAGAVYLY